MVRGLVAAVGLLELWAGSGKPEMPIAPYSYGGYKLLVLNAAAENRRLVLAGEIGCCSQLGPVCNAASWGTA